jgi:hypothetical protein
MISSFVGSELELESIPNDKLELGEPGELGSGLPRGIPPD